ncbi:MAG: N-acetyl sugar amidotransferase [Deltaproteobacteria bacterium]|nr:N-acetyl sugar amidotransferase [Deltaproteobacteria bacterium]
MAQIGNFIFSPRLHGGRKIPYAEHTRHTIYERQLAQLPEEVVFCKKCVMSNQRPRIVFDEEGVCGACRWWEEKENTVDWEDRHKEFEELLDRHRSKDGSFDVLVPSSGGKDSGSIAHKLKYEYGMHPLSVTWSPLLYTDIGFQNLQNMISSGIPSHLFTPNRILQRVISKLGLILIGNHFEAFGRGQISYVFHVALDMGIKLVMFGENGELEYGGTLRNKDIPGQPIGDWVELYHKGCRTDEMLQFGVENGYLEKEALKDPTLKYFSPPPAEALVKAGVEFHWFGYYHKWLPQENFYYVAENYGFRTWQEGHSESTYSKYASLDDLTDPPHYYLSYIKFGIGRATSDAAHEIREGHLTREEGIALVHRYDHIFPDRYFREFLEYMDMTEEEYWEVIDAWREKRPGLWQKVNGEWKLMHQVS